MTDFEKFKQDRGYEFKTEEALVEGYYRSQKATQGLLITETEFITEAGPNYDEATLKAVYAKLYELGSIGQLTAGDIYHYARFRWCLRSPDAIVAYEVGRERWIVNNCSDAISVADAIINVNGEWGFEASKIKIIGTPYYCASDYQFIRFDCARMTWLWCNGELHQVYA